MAPRDGWLKAANKYGWPSVGLVVLGYVIYLIGGWAVDQGEWTKAEVIKPLVARSIKYLDDNAAEMKQQSAVLQSLNANLTELKNAQLETKNAIQDGADQQVEVMAREHGKTRGVMLETAREQKASDEQNMNLLKQWINQRPS